MPNLRALGVTDGDTVKMREEVKANVEREVARRVKARVKEQVMQALLNASKLALPGSLVQMEAQRLQQAAHRELEARGIDAQEARIAPDAFDSQAQRRVGLGLVIAELVKSQGLHAKPEQVRAAVEDLAQSFEHPAEVVKWYYQSPERLAEVESLVVEDNVVEYVLGKARVEDQAIAFDDLMAKG